MNKLFFVSILFVAACSSARPAAEAPLPEPEVVPDSVVWNGDPELAVILRRGMLGAAENNAADRVEAFLGRAEFISRLGLIAEDSANPWVVRANALKLLADRAALSEMTVFAIALRAREERVRMTAVSAMKEMMPIAPAAAVQILERALRDPNIRIQLRALEILSDRDVRILREYHARATNEELRGVARSLIQTAEERAAPLVPKDSAGTLERTSFSGAVITFRPTMRWPNWDAAAGELHVRPPRSRQSVRVASNVEVVNNVVPAFMMSDSTTIVYEVNREIHARSLRDNTDRKLGNGIAPRIFPFTNDVLYFREIPNKKVVTAQATTYRYQLIRVPFAGGDEKVIGEIAATAQNAVKGNASPVRWSRIQEREGRFYLVGETIADFELPSPFGG